MYITQDLCSFLLKLLTGLETGKGSVRSGIIWSWGSQTRHHIRFHLSPLNPHPILLLPGRAYTSCLLHPYPAFFPQATSVVGPCLSTPHPLQRYLKKKRTELQTLKKFILYPKFSEKSPLLVTCFQFSSVAQLCPTLFDPMNRSRPGLPVRYQLPEFTQTHIH